MERPSSHCLDWGKITFNRPRQQADPAALWFRYGNEDCDGVYLHGQ
jgi:hypothetical protein